MPPCDVPELHYCHKPEWSRAVVQYSLSNQLEHFLLSIPALDDYEFVMPRCFTNVCQETWTASCSVKIR